MNFDIPKLKPALVEFALTNQSSIRFTTLIFQMPGGSYLFHPPEMDKSKYIECSEKTVLSITRVERKAPSEAVL